MEVNIKAMNIQSYKKEKNIININGKGRAIDNMCKESFQGTIKYACIPFQSKSDGLSLFQGINQFLTFYNAKRSHQSLDNQTSLNKYQYVV